MSAYGGRAAPRPVARAQLRARAVCLAAVLGATFPVLAYIPPVGSLLRRAAARALEQRRIGREATLNGALRIGAGPAAPAQLVLRFPLQCRIEGAASVQGEPDRPVVRAEGEGPLRELLELACPLLAYRGLAVAEAERALRAAATEAGVDLAAPSSLARQGDRAVFVLGASAHQLDRPQLWLYKDSHAPARLVARRSGRLDDLRLLQYGNPAAADWFPRVIELWQDGRLAAQFEALETQGLRETSEEESADEQQ